MPKGDARERLVETGGFIVGILMWLRLAGGLAALGGILAVLAVDFVPGTFGIVLAVVIALTGFLVGVTSAERLRRAGTLVEFIAWESKSPDLDDLPPLASDLRYEEENRRKGTSE